MALRSCPPIEYTALGLAVKLGPQLLRNKTESQTVFVPRSFFLQYLFFLIFRYFYGLSRYQPVVYPAQSWARSPTKAPFFESLEIQGKMDSPIDPLARFLCLIFSGSFDLLNGGRLQKVI
jgi:hypothetical protein